MFDFYWDESLRYCTYDCSPLSNRQLVVEVMDETGVDEFELAHRMDVAVDVVRDWVNGLVRPRYRDIDRVCEACEFDAPPGFGLDSSQLVPHEDDIDHMVGDPDPDPLGHDREDMASAGWMSMPLEPWDDAEQWWGSEPWWDPAEPGPRGNVTA